MAHRGIYPDSQKNPSGSDVDQFLSDMKMASMSHQSLSMRAPSGHSGDVGVARGATNRGFSPWLPAPNTSNNPYAHEVRPRYCVQPDAVRGNIPRPAANLPNPSHRLSYPCVPQNVTSHLFMESPDLRAPSPRAEFKERPPALNPSQSFNLPQNRPPVDNIYRRPFENNTFQSWRTNMQDMKPQNPLPMNSQKSVVVNNEGMQSKTHYSINRTPPGNIQQYSQQVNHGQPRLATRPYQANQSLPVVQNDCGTHNTTMEHYNVHQGNSFVSDMNHGAPSATLWNEAQGVDITGVKPNWRTDSNGNRSSEETEEKRRDQNWVDMWLQRLGKRRSSPARKSEITIADYKSYLQEALKLKAELQNLREDLSEDLSAEEFQEKMKNVSKTRARLEGVNRKLTDEATLVNIERLVSKRKAKRGRLKRKRQALYQDKQTELARQSQLHKEMDTVQARLLQQSFQEKQDKEMKAAADQILGEVRRKLWETSKTIEVINSLRKLRQLRLNTKGMYLGMEADTMFQTRTDHLLSFLTDRKKTYEAEEKTLKVMLETEQEEEREREQARLREREARRTRQEHALYTQRLFGKEDQLTTADPLFPYRQFYTQAEGSLEALIAVRHGWDVCLVAEGTPGGSKIPQGWVLPPAPASPAWSTALKQ